MWLLLSFACSRPPSLEGTCALSEDNALRARCTLEVDPPAPITLSLEGAGDTLTRSSPEASSHSIALRRMRSETRYQWTARAGEAEISGELTTGPLPASADVAVVRDGAEPSSDTMFVASCGDAFAVVLDPQGQVVWYQDLGEGIPEPADGEHSSNSLTLTEDGTLLAILDRHTIREFSLDGDLLLEIPYGDGETRVLHHDTFRRGGRTFALTAHLEEIEDIAYIVDGIAAFEPDGRMLFDWSLGDLAPVSGPSGIGAVYWTDLWLGARDWAHANGVYIDTDGDPIVSLHSFSTILRLEGDPDNPAFGQPVWSLSGRGGGPFGSDLLLTDPSGLSGDDTFGHQHHPSLLADGSLQLFDNGDDVSDTSRVLRATLDPEAGEAAISGSFPLDAVCPIEGSAFVRPDGDLVATCALHSTFYEIDSDSGAVTGSTKVLCRNAAGIDIIPRAIPVDLEEP